MAEEGEMKDKAIHRYVMGDMSAINEWMENKPWMIQLPNWVLRGIGAPIFLNNPISGLLILVAMFINSAWVTVCALIGLLAAIFTASLIGLPRGDIASGGATFHGMLVGIVITSSVDKPDWYPWLIFPILILAATSVYLAAGLGKIFSTWNLPAFNLPFNLAAFAFLAAIKYSSPNANFPLKPGSPLLPNESFSQADINWAKIFQPILLADAQIYGSTKLVVGALVLAAQFVCSPIIGVHAVLSAVVSALTALALAAPPSEIYDGVWSYNAMLTCTCLAGFFFVLNPHSHILALFSAMFATVTYGAMSAVLRPTGLPTIAFPFVITASIFLAVSTQNKHFRRVPMDNITFPEKHMRLYGINYVEPSPA